jgi:hypothetical protein
MFRYKYHIRQIRRGHDHMAVGFTVPFDERGTWKTNLMETNLTIANTCASGFNNDYKSNPYPGKISVS